MVPVTDGGGTRGNEDVMTGAVLLLHLLSPVKGLGVGGDGVGGDGPNCCAPGGNC